MQKTLHAIISEKNQLLSFSLSFKSLVKGTSSFTWYKLPTPISSLKLKWTVSCLTLLPWCEEFFRGAYSMSLYIIAAEVLTIFIDANTRVKSTEIVHEIETENHEIKIVNSIMTAPFQGRYSQGKSELKGSFSYWSVKVKKCQVKSGKLKKSQGNLCW